MTRCVSAAALAALACACALPVLAQTHRQFPADALRGELVIDQPPSVRLNNQPARLSPGSRIRDENNLLAMSGSLAGRKLLVHYTTDPYGLVHDVWVLNAAERARKTWPSTREQSQSWRFDPVGQVWSRP